jgi:hypothetical protein
MISAQYSRKGSARLFKMSERSSAARSDPTYSAFPAVRAEGASTATGRIISR